VPIRGLRLRRREGSSGPQSVGAASAFNMVTAPGTVAVASQHPGLIAPSAIHWHEPQAGPWLCLQARSEQRMAIKRCLACGVAFPLRPQSPDQAYCAATACQRDRRKHWQRERRQTDHEYRENQARAHERWLAQHPDYWREYRAAHSDYADRNRLQQRQRNRDKARPEIANMDPSTRALVSGTYRLTRRAAGGDVANMDSWIVEITVLSGTYRNRLRLQREDPIVISEAGCYRGRTGCKQETTRASRRGSRGPGCRPDRPL
jgi:hypothetical protein